MNNYLESFDLLSYSQSSFRPGHFTQDLLLHVTDSWRKSIDSRETAGAVLLDLSKVFDCVDHTILLTKLAHYRIRDSALSWFQSYLGGRVQCIRLGKEVSDLGKVTCGVPQASILGPILFDLPQIDLPPQCHMSIYADDVMIYTSSPSLEDLQSRLQISLHSINQWALYNKMVINKYAVWITSKAIRSRSLNLSLNGTPISYVQSAKYLGLLIDSQLT